MDRKKKIKTAIICVSAAALLALCGTVGYAVYGGAQMKKLQTLSAADALCYTLKGQKDGLITVGTITGGEASFKVYGENGEEVEKALHTYEIGSLTKTFTASLVCKAVKEGKLGLDEPVGRYLDLPNSAHYPTIRELVTHTSGYKSFYFEQPMTANFFKGRNSFYGVGDSMIEQRLGKVDVSDGEHEFCYSNFGYAALGLVLEKVYQTEFTTLMNGYVKNELGLSSTHLSDGVGDLDDYWDWVPGDTYMAAGALLSDVSDMLTYARLQLDRAVCGGENLALLAEIDATTKQNEAYGIRMDGIAYGFILDEENGYVWHNGGTGDFNCYFGLDLENGNAVVVLSNLAPSFRIPATVIGVKLLGELKG